MLLRYHGKGKNGNGNKGNRKIGQLEKSATKNERVGIQGNTKLMCEITATEKRQWENGQRENSAMKTEMLGKQGNAMLLSEITKTEKTEEKTATGKMGSRKLGNRKIQQQKMAA